MPKPKTPAPSLEEAIGEISIAWSNLELALTMVMAELMRTDSTTAMVITAAMDYRHRRDLINSLAAIKLRDTQVLNDLTWFMGHVKGMNTKRNAAIHALWHRPAKGLPTRMTFRNQGAYEMKFKRVSPRHLKEIERKIGTLADIGLDLVARVRAGTHAWHKTHAQRDWPHLESLEHHQESMPDILADRPQSSPE